MPKNKVNSFGISVEAAAGAQPAAEPWVDPDDAPELTDELIQYIAETAEIRDGERIIRPGRPPLDELLKKTVVTIRLDPDIVESYRALGAGWQTQLNADLRRVRKLGKKLKTA